MNDIITLDQARRENLGQQAPAGHRLKSRKQIEREREVLTAAQNEEARVRAMGAWYRNSEQVLWALYQQLGFPAHSSEDEKLSLIAATLTGLAAKIVAADAETDIEEQVSAFRTRCESERKLMADQKAAERHTMMAAVVAGLIEEPALAKLEGVPAFDKVLEEPWLGCSATLTDETREEREADAFAWLKSSETCPAGATATLLRGKLTALADFTVEAKKEGFLMATKRLAEGEGGGVVEPGEGGGVVPLVDAEKLRNDMEQTAAEFEEEIEKAEGLEGEPGAV